LPDYAAHEAVYFSQAITADDFAMKKNPKYVNKVVAPTLEPISSIGGFRTLPDYSFDTMPDDYVALVLIGGFGWNTPVAEKVMPIIKSAIEQEKVIDEIAAAKVFREIGPERIAEIDMAVSKWRSEGGFRDSNLTLSSFARRIMVNRTDVASYLTSIYGKNFRTWLSGIRVEEAKALMAAHPEYSNEVVSMECGFSSRVYFQRLFKERTGLTPAEWRRQR